MKNNKIKIKVCESVSQWLIRDSIELNLDDYPELAGKSEDEMKEYIYENWETMKSPIGGSNLYDALTEQDIVHEKDTNSEYHIYFD